MSTIIKIVMILYNNLQKINVRSQSAHNNHYFSLFSGIIMGRYTLRILTRQLSQFQNFSACFISADHLLILLITLKEISKSVKIDS